MLKKRAVAAVLLAGLVMAAACTSDDSGSDSSGLPGAITEVMKASPYRHAEWGWHVVDLASGEVVSSSGAEQFFFTGSTMKLNSVSAAWDALGPDHRFETPVYGLGPVNDGTLAGNLVLVASGDLTLGGRTTAEGTVAFANFDHNDANALPGATLTPQDPLAGLDDIARQVRGRGVTRVDGDVVIDDRLFEPHTFVPGEDEISPIIVNDNLVDVLTTASEVGQPATVTIRPQSPMYSVDSQVQTVDTDGETSIEISADEGGRIRVTGTIIAGDDPALKVVTVEDPPTFARTLLIAALARAGVQVSAPPTGPNPEALLPPSGPYAADQRLAVYTSPPFSEYAKLILKVSHNMGANLSVCLLATRAGSTDCDDGFAAIRDFLGEAGVDPTDLTSADGQGIEPGAQSTPTAAVTLLQHWQGRPDFDRFRASLPILGVDGSLSLSETDSPARGRVQAKTGTGIGADMLNGRISLREKSLAGYIDAGSGRTLAFSLYMNRAVVDDIIGVFGVNNDLARVAAIWQAEE